MKAEVFDPFDMHDSGVDDDGPIAGTVAQGNQLDGTFGLKPAPAIHWSAKSGNGSAYTTVLDEQKWVQGFLGGSQLSESSRRTMIESSQGYGWERPVSVRFGERVYLIGGRSPGFSSFIMYLPAESICLVVLTNIENAANSSIVQNVAADLLGKPYTAFTYTPVPPGDVGHPAGDFTFGPDFYRPSATLRLVSDDEGVALTWPGGPNDPLLPIAKDKFIDRYYWNDVALVRSKDGMPVELDYGKFRGLLRGAPSTQRGL
jgi:hypothetical protein